MDELGRPSRGASLSPDGRALAYLVEVDGYPQAVQRWRFGDELSEPRWVSLPVDGPVTRVAHSPDSRWLACQVAPGGGERNQVWLITTDPSDPSAWRIDDGLDSADGRPPPADAQLVGWAGERIAISVQTHDGSGEGRLVDPATREVEVVDRRPGGMMLDSECHSHLIRSGPRTLRRVHLVRGGREVELLPGDPGSNTDRGHLLDAERCLVRSDHDSEYARLLLVDEAGHRVLAERDDAELDEFVVSHDHTHVVLLWNVAGGFSELQLLELGEDDDRGDVAPGVGTDGGGRSRLTARSTPPIPLPASMASEPSITADGSLLALTLQGPGRATVVHLFAPASAQWLAIEPVLHETRTLAPELLRFAASDGLELNGWWYQAPISGVPNPPAEPGTPGPVALWFHGGPEGQSRPEWSYLIPSLLAAGVSVFAANVRGSSGLGRGYLHADDVERRWRGIADVVDIVGYLVGTGRADPERIAATGRSYGGYLVNACLAFHPELFAVGVSICGMSDLNTFYRDTEVWIAKAAHSKYGHPRRDRELLTELSPVRAVTEIRVPLLCLHGGADTNVPVNESMQLVEALTELGKPASCVVIADEGHEFSRPMNRLRAAGLLTEWVCRGLGLPAGIPAE